MKRLELKYLLTLRLYQDALALVKCHSRLDNPCQSGEPYAVCSTYFDTPDFAYYLQKKNGVAYRKKYRFRTYGLDADSGFFEIKYREHAYVHKQRTSFRRENLLNILHEDIEQKDFNREQQMVYQMLMGQNLKPTHLIHYKRVAYVAQQENPFRITFDFELSTANVQNHSGLDATQHRLFNSHVIMELKPHESLPLWCYQMLKELKLVSSSISKYALTLEKLKIFN